MTTIAFDGKILAADSRLSGAIIRSENFNKIFKVNGAIVAGCGRAEDLMAFVQWIKDGKPKDKPTVDDSFAALVYKNGVMTRYEERLFGFPPSSKIIAAGSGFELALGAMSAGASAIQAIKIAAKFDPATNNKVKWMRIV